MLMLPVLVRQARSQRPITYAAVAAEVGMTHHRTVSWVAGRIGHALAALGVRKGWRRRPPPPLQALIVNGRTRAPGHGVDGFMDRRFREARTDRQRAAALLTAHAAIYAYPFWDEVMEALDADPAAARLDALTGEATRSRGRGGEGPAHRALKEHVAANPSLVGLPAGHPPGVVEWDLPSGDAIDVVFASPGRLTAVEVKSRISGRGDVARGVYQCVKYLAVLEAQSSVADERFDASAVLVLEGTLDPDAMSLANAFGVRVVERVTPG